jgi:hypothetical protein
MKKFSYLTWVCFILFLMVTSCAKDPQVSSTGTKPTLTLSKTDVKVAEPLLASTSGQSSGSIVHWATSNNGHVGTSVTTDSASLVFTSPGAYTVTAYYFTPMGIAPYDSSFANVTVNDSIYNNTPVSVPGCDADTIKYLLPNDELTITPILSDSGLVFVGTSKFIYSNSAFLYASGNLTGAGGKYEGDFDSTLNYVCYGSSIPGNAYSIVSFAHGSNGTFDLTFRLNGVSYAGSFTLSDTGINIVWNYTSGIIISPLTVSK